MSIYYHAINLISSVLYAGYSILIIGSTFVLDECQIQYLSCLTVKSCQNTGIPSPIGCIEMDKSMTA